MSATPAQDISTVDTAAFIDAQPVSAFQIKVLLTCAAVLFLDGYDTTAIGYVAPSLAREWHIGKEALGPVFGAGLFGLMIGALLLSPLADRIGRKKIIVISTVAFGVGTLVTFFVNDVGTLFTIRLLTGLGLGGAMPNAVALTSEFSPHRRRATMVMLMFVGFAIGSALGGLLAAAMIPQLGWRSVFVVGGVAPLVLAPILIWRLPESVRYLALSGRADARVAELLTFINPKAAFAAGARFVVNEPELKGIPIQHLFTERRALSTLLLWVVFFMSLLEIYFMSNWLPTVLSDLGASISTAAAIGAMFQVGGILGTFVLGSIIDRFAFRALALVYFVAAFAIGAIGQLGHSPVFVTIAIFIAGLCIVGGQCSSNALAAGLYPTSARATGVGWALGIGRIGSIVGPLVGGILLSLKWNIGEVFGVAAAAALCAALAAFLLGRRAGLGGTGKSANDRTSALQAVTQNGA